MPEPPYRALSILLRVFSLLAALGGLLLIFAEKPLIVRILLRPPEGEVSTLFLSLLKEMDGMLLMLGGRVALWAAATECALGTHRKFLRRALAAGRDVARPDTVALWPDPRQRKR